MSWLNDKITREHEGAMERVGIEKGRVEAFRLVRDLLDPIQHCQSCGYQYWAGESIEKHLVRHPECAPKADQPKEG